MTCTHILKKTCGCPKVNELLVAPPVVAPNKPASVAHLRAPNTSPWSPAAREAERARDMVSEKSLLETLEALLSHPDPATRALAEDEVRKAIDRQLAKSYFAEYCRQAWRVVEPGTRLEWNWHHELVCWVLQAMYLAWKNATQLEIPLEIRNVIFNLPPGSAKSRLISVFLPTWIWTDWPSFKFICLSVNETAAMRDARQSRDLIKSDWYQITFQPGWKIKADQDSVSDYANTRGGGRLSRASGSEIVGLRGDGIFIDDANNPYESESKKVRDEVNEMWDTNQYNRVNAPQRSIRIGVQQRTHTADWTGHVLDLQGTWDPTRPEGWLHIPIPAEYEASQKFSMPEPLRRALREAGIPDEVIIFEDPRTVEGDSVHPTRWPKEWLAGEKKRMREQYAGQMQQRPVMATGGKVKHTYLGFCRLASGVHPLHEEIGVGSGRPAGCNQEVPALIIPAKWHAPGHWDLDWIMISVDPANQRTENGSNWGLLVIAGKGGRRFVLDDQSQRGDPDEILDVLIKMIKEWRPDKILIEKKAAGPTLLMMLQKELVEAQNGKLVDEAGHPIMVELETVLPDGLGDKEERLLAVLPIIKNGLLYVLDGASWLVEWVQEVVTFPSHPRSDRVDALSQCLAHEWAKEVQYPEF